MSCTRSQKDYLGRNKVRIICHDKIEALIKEGHTHHCACCIVYGDGECECQKSGVIPGTLSREIEELGFSDEEN